MQVKRTDLSDTKVKLHITASEEYLAPIKEHVVQRLGKNVKVAGFREGKAPLGVIEKNIDQALLQTEVIDEALNHLYFEAATAEKLRPLARPEVNLKKFVPFTTLEFEAEVEILGTVKLPDYKKIKKTKPTVKVTDKDVTDVIDNIKMRFAEKKEVSRASKKGDEVVIDFKGVDDKGEPVRGAESKDYPLQLGSNVFIPGFEENVIGLKPSSEKTFTLTFPKDYGVKALANKKVTFTVTVKKVHEVVAPQVDDAFAKKAGPFEGLTQLKNDIKEQLQLERQKEAQRNLQNEIIKEIAEKAKLHIPETLVIEQVEQLATELKQNLAYRGLTYKEYLEQEGKDEAAFQKDVLRPEAELRVKTGLVLSEIASEEKLDVTDQELEAYMQVLRSQYKDPAMQAELDKPESRRDIASRMLTEKTVQRLTEYATKNT